MQYPYLTITDHLEYVEMEYADKLLENAKELKRRELRMLINLLEAVLVREGFEVNSEEDRKCFLNLNIAMLPWPSY